MLCRAEEQSASDSPPANAASLPNEAEVKKRQRQEEHDRRRKTGIVVVPPERHANMEKRVRENETCRSETRPDETSVSPHRDEEWKPDEERIGAINCNRSKFEAARGPDSTHHGPRVLNQEVGPPDKVDAVLL